MRKIVDTYAQLGVDYLNNIQGISVQGRQQFLSLLTKGGNLLDVGCAGGRDTAVFIRKGFRAVGIDVVPSFVKEARKRVPVASFHCMDLMKLRFPAETFDGIWANAVLLHLRRSDVPPALHEFYRVLKLGGKIHIRVKLGDRSGVRRDALSNQKKRSFTFFQKNEMERFMKNTGFRILVSRLYQDETRRKGVRWVSIWAEKVPVHT